MTALLKSCVDLIEFDRGEIEPKIQDDDSRRRFDDHIEFLSDAALIYAFHSDCQTRNPQCALLDRLSILRSTPIRNGDSSYSPHSLQFPWEMHNPGTTLRTASANADIHEFLILAIKYGLVAYVREKLRHHFSGHPIEASYASMLQLMITIRTDRTLDYPPPRFEMVELLLQLGADPNAHYNGQSAWEAVLHDIVRRLPAREFERDYFRKVSLLIENRASPFAEIIRRTYAPGTEHDAPHPKLTALQILESARGVFPEEVDGLIQALRNRNHPRHEDRRHDRRRWERRERIDNDYASRRRRR
jgi:hypothetical protein